MTKKTMMFFLYYTFFENSSQSVKYLIWPQFINIRGAEGELIFYGEPPNKILLKNFRFGRE